MPIGIKVPAERTVLWRAWCAQIGRMMRPLGAGGRAILAAWRKRRAAARIYVELSELSDNDLRRCGLERRDLYRRAIEMAARYPRSIM
jgi:hypothetical protein